MNVLTTTVADADPGDGLTPAQREARDRARQRLAARRQLVEQRATAARRRAEATAVEGETVDSILWRAMLMLAEDGVDTSPLLPKQAPEKGSG